MNLLELFGPITTFIFETNGVLADGIYTVTEDGKRSYQLNSKDTYALHVAISKGYKVWLVTNGNDEWLKEWSDAGIGLLTNGDDNIAAILQTDQDHNSLLYMGSDIPAYTAMRNCGLPVCPANAVPEIKSISKYISPMDGGKGCVRDVIEKVLKLNGHWQVPG